MFLSSQCANRLPPTGGPKDESPPFLINSIPKDQSLDFRGRLVILEFNEWIKAANLRKELLITPPTKDIETKVIRDRLEITFKEPLLDSTTYSLNFRKGLVDITEGNVAVIDTIDYPSLKIAFSTGNIIDSLKVAGKVINLQNNEPISDAVISIFNIQDTLNYDEDQPYYFTFSDKEGNFIIENIKGAPYEIFAFRDDNGDLVYQEPEPIGFLRDTLIFNDSTSILSELTLKLAIEDHSPPEILSKKPLGQNYQVEYREGLKSYQLSLLDSSDFKESDFPNHLINNAKTINLYNPQAIYDTLSLEITAYDSLNNSKTDTISLVFREPGKRQRVTKAAFDLKLKNLLDEMGQDSIQLVFEFSKPVKTYNFDQIQIFPDADSSRIQNLINPADSLSSFEWKNQDTYLRIDRSIKASSFQILIDTLAFVSIQEDTLGAQNQTFQKKDPSNYGNIKGKVETEEANYLIELLNEGREVIRSQANVREYNFSYLPAGTYSIRVVLDRNGNGKWDSSKVSERQEPEEILFFSLPNEGKLRERWEIPNADLSF